MRCKVVSKTGLYDGPYERNLVTYKLLTSSGEIVTWHENGKRGLKAEVNDVLSGLFLRNGKPCYTKSKIKSIFTQLKIEL